MYSASTAVTVQISSLVSLDARTCLRRPDNSRDLAHDGCSMAHVTTVEQQRNPASDLSKHLIETCFYYLLIYLPSVSFHCRICLACGSCIQSGVIRVANINM